MMPYGAAIGDLPQSDRKTSPQDQVLISGLVGSRPTCACAPACACARLTDDNLLGALQLRGHSAFSEEPRTPTPYTEPHSV